MANIVIPNDERRKAFRRSLKNLGLPLTNIFGQIGCEVAYETGEPWLVELIDYLDGNRQFVRDFINSCLPMIRLVDVEATYLLWLDLKD